MIRPLPLILTAAAGLVAITISSIHTTAGAQTVNDGFDRHGQLDFTGRYIVSISDADMVASAYINGVLGPREGRDAISVIPLDGDPRDWQAHETLAPNSVAGPPAAVDLTPDGRYAFVVESWTERPDNNDRHTFGDLSHGNRLTVIDLGDPTNPRAVQEIETPERPDAVRVSPDGRLVAVTFHPSGAGTENPLSLYRFTDGQLGARVDTAGADWVGQVGRLIDVDWHPTEPVLAMIDERQASLTFARVDDDLAVTPFGNVVDIERAPYRVEFTPDGRHAVVNALYWGPDIAGTWTEAPRGSVVTVRLNAEERDGGNIRHAFISRATTGVSPEGLAVSPDGRWVATTNLERSYLPYDDPRITFFSSLTLVSLDQETGQLTRIGDFNYDGILPEAAVFDNSGNYLAVANYDHFNDRRAGGSIDFWRIQADPLDQSNIQLIKTEHSVPVTRGAHSMVIAR